jgi:hypothetical protein
VEIKDFIDFIYVYLKKKNPFFIKRIFLCLLKIKYHAFSWKRRDALC